LNQSTVAALRDRKKKKLKEIYLSQKIISQKNVQTHLNQTKKNHYFFHIEG